MLNRIIFIGLITASLLVVFLIYPKKYIWIGDIRFVNSLYGIGFSDVANLNAYFTISPLDDILIRKDGSEIKAAKSTLDGYNYDHTGSLIYNYYDAVKKIISVILFRREDMEFDNSLLLEGDYSIEKEKNLVTIIRTIEYTDNVVGIGRSLIYPTDSKIVIDGKSIIEFLEQKNIESGTYSISGIREILIISPYSTSSVKLLLEKNDLLVIDLKYQLITIKHYFSELKSPQVDKQTIYFEKYPKL